MVHSGTHGESFCADPSLIFSHKSYKSQTQANKEQLNEDLEPFQIHPNKTTPSLLPLQGCGGQQSHPPAWLNPFFQVSPTLLTLFCFFCIIYSSSLSFMRFVQSTLAGIKHNRRMSDNCVHKEKTELGEFTRACFQMHIRRHTTCSDTPVLKLVNTPTSLWKIIHNGLTLWAF